MTYVFIVIAEAKAGGYRVVGVYKTFSDAMANGDAWFDLHKGQPEDWSIRVIERALV